jgi:enterochelin esterase family protein
MRPLLLVLVAISCLAQAPAPYGPPYAEALKLARSGSPELRELLNDGRMKKGAAYAAHMGEFLFAVDAESAPTLVIDDQPGPKMTKAKAGYWFATAKLAVGRTHNFHYLAGGQRFGGAGDVPAFTADSYEKPGVAKGTLDGKHTHTSRIYDGMVSDYWVYVPAQYNSSTPAAVMVWQDGEVLVPRELPSRAQIVFDNLSSEKKIPPIIHVLISPGMTGSRRMRSIEYDTVDDAYSRFLMEEILAEVGKKYKLRQDGYSRAIAGDSSGGICAFNAAWFHPEQFSRVLSRIGSFTSIQWQPGKLDGGNIYPFAIRKQPKRNIRVWLQDGSGDLENNHGSWPMQNIAMANSLKLRGYDFRFSWGNGAHSRNSGHTELAEEMMWLWRDYDASKTSQEFTPDPEEKEKPFFRVERLNRER